MRRFHISSATDERRQLSRRGFRFSFSGDISSFRLFALAIFFDFRRHFRAIAEASPLPLTIFVSFSSLSRLSMPPFRRRYMSSCYAYIGESKVEVL